MTSYDSDSSLDDDEQGGTSTNVLLGYATREAVDDSISQLGGEPTWLSSEHPASGSLAQCKCCNNPMALLLQLNGELPDRFSGHERRLYIFACKRTACRRKPGSIRAIRGVRLSKSAKAKQTQAQARTPQPEVQPPKPQTQNNVGASLFGGKPTASTSTNPFASTNPFSSSSSSGNPARANPFSTALGPASTLAAKPSQTPSTSSSAPPPPEAAENITTLPATFAEKARISSPPTASQVPSHQHTPWPPASARPTPYPTYSLDADYEHLSAPPSAPANPNISANHAALMDVDGPAPTSAGDTGKEDALAYESAHDKAFQHFADTLAQNPEQVLRYEFAGQPLLYSRTDAVGKLFASAAGGQGSSKGIPRCVKCGAKRVFEVQLTPHAIVELEDDDGDEGDAAATAMSEGMEWGSILMGVCERDCGGEAEGGEYLEEWAGVQWEEVVSRRG